MDPHHGNVHDKNFLRFQSAVFNQLLTHYGELARNTNHQWSARDLFFAAQLLLKGKDSYTFWKHDKSSKGHVVLEFLMRLASLIVRAKIGA